MKKHTAKKPVQKESLDFGRIALVLGIVIVLGFLGYQQFYMQGTQTDQNYEIPIEDYNNSYKPPEGSPSMFIISPKPGEVFKSSTIGIRVNVTNFQLVDIVAERQNVENQGHLLYTLDGREQRGVYKTASFANVPKGQHTLRIELQDNDRTPTSPAVFAVVTFTTE